MTMTKILKLIMKTIANAYPSKYMSVKRKL